MVVVLKPMVMSYLFLNKGQFCSVDESLKEFFFNLWERTANNMTQTETEEKNQPRLVSEAVRRIYTSTENFTKDRKKGHLHGNHCA